MTPRELSILMQAETERRYDEYETMANQAMMIRAAYHAKRLKQRDLFKRPATEAEKEGARERMQERINRLSKYEEFAGMFDDIKDGREEETNGE